MHAVLLHVWMHIWRYSFRPLMCIFVFSVAYRYWWYSAGAARTGFHTFRMDPERIQVDWMAMTRKWSFDIRDGMHHGEPPIRMLAYLLMHHICHGAE